MLIRDVTLTDPPVVVEAEAAGAYELLIELSVLTGEGRRRRSTRPPIGRLRPALPSS
jgi:hypothetical protein